MLNKGKTESELDTGLFRLLFAQTYPETFAAGQVLFQQGDQAERLYGILSGTIEISLFSTNGRKLVANVQSSGLLGEIGTLDGGSRTASATCIEECRVVSISRTQLLDRVQRHPSLAIALIGILCIRLRRISDQLGYQSLLNIEGRVANRLVTLLATMPEENEWIATSQAELADLLGVTRESVNKTLQGWVRAGIVEIRRGAIKVHDMGELLKLAGDTGL